MELEFHKEKKGGGHQVLALMEFALKLSQKQEAPKEYRGEKETILNESLKSRFKGNKKL